MSVDNMILAVLDPFDEEPVSIGDPAIGDDIRRSSPEFCRLQAAHEVVPLLAIGDNLSFHNNSISL